MAALDADDLQLVPRRQANNSAGQKNIFSVDVEEWFQVGAFENTLSRDDWPQLESRVELQTTKILQLLKTANTKATFFCLGWVAERAPDLIRTIADQGHEIACHGMDHQRVFRFSEKEFFDDVSRAKSLLEDASGKPVNGYRAPSFSMSQETWGFYHQLVAAGFRYSSSLVPAQTDHYGASGLPRTPFYPIENCNFVELPMTVAEVFGRTVPASGGGYFRLLPSMIAEWLMKKARQQTGLGTVFYMHPWEIDPEQPFVKEAPVKSRLRHYTGQKKMAAKLGRLLSGREFVPANEFLSTEFSVDLV